MTKRDEHTFQFDATDIAGAAKAEAEYHESRVAHYEDRRDKALVTVEQTIGAKVTRNPVTNGVQAAVVVDYGDPEAWREYSLCFGKVEEHRAAAERYRTDERVYGTQTGRTYELDTSDVHHFRLGGQARDA